jgi:SAM-dependent methyltransferase
MLEKEKEIYLECKNCKKRYMIVNSIPRFVENEKYAASFGFEWNIHKMTQYDSYYGKNLSERRFFEETEWDRNLLGEIIIEVGCGSGRFTEWALKTGATVLSFDLSNAVEANMENNGSHHNLFLFQADLFKLPIKKGVADKLFCFGMLQHTPDPKKALYTLIPFVKERCGEIVFDIYNKRFHTKYLIRPITKRLPPRVLYKLCKTWINLMWPVASALRKISPKHGPKINWQLMIADYSREGIPHDMLKEWSYLDTFDMLSPRFDIPASLEEVESWLIQQKKEGRIKDFTVKYGYNGIQGKIYR